MSNSVVDPGDGSRSAAQLFAAHVRATAGAWRGDDPKEEESEFAALCRRHAEFADELRVLRDHWRPVQDVVAALLDHRPLHERLRDEYGSTVGIGVSLDDAEDPQAGGMPSGGATVRSEAEASPAAPSSRRVGRAERYTRKEELGRGGMGVVYKVLDADLHRHLAMKVVRTRAGRPASLPSARQPVDSAALSRFLEEAQITAQLAHPNIAPVHDLGLDAGGAVYFTMHLVRGNTFGDVIRWVGDRKPGWTQTRALAVLLDVCDALSFAHAKGVIHRDVKPANVMVGRFGETYVMDWGLARVLGRSDSHDVRVKPQEQQLSSIHTSRRDAEESRADAPVVTMDGAVVGTPAYMSPEQAAGRIEAMGPHSDVYAVGTMLYQLLTGQAPYVVPGARVSPYVVLAAVMTGPPAPIRTFHRQVPAEVEAICEKAMTRSIAERYADTRALADDLRAYIDRRVVKAYQTGAGAELRKWVERNRGLAAAIAAVVLIAAAGAITVTAVQTRANTDLQSKNSELGLRNTELATARNTAEEEKRSATARLAEVQRLSDLKRLRDLKERADALWPAWPENVAAIDQWLVDARALRDRLPLHRTSLQKLVVASEEDAWWRQQLTELVRELDGFVSPQDPSGVLSAPVTIAAVEQRVSHAAWVEQVSLDEAVDEWKEAIERIARHPRYGGLRIAEQTGLVPIGPDPASGLEEFWVVETGARPEREGESRRLVVAEGMGMVLVLLPGGTFAMGAQPADAQHASGSPNVDPMVQPEERPVHAVTLAPYFQSKWEATQGQWIALTGTNPAWYSSSGGGGAHSLTCPIETVNWSDCVRAGRRVGLRLPSDAQWEFAARGGTTSVWWSGDDVRSVARAGNVADRSAAGAGNVVGAAESWDDSYADVAPVGRFAANPFGLHDVVGNVWEWSEDEYVVDAYARPWRAGDGLLEIEAGAGAGFRNTRGGAFFLASEHTRSANRNQLDAGLRAKGLGVRFARSVMPAPR